MKMTINIFSIMFVTLFNVWSVSIADTNDIPATQIQGHIDEANNVLLYIDYTYTISQELQDSIKLLFKNDITIYDNPESFMYNNFIRRDEAAKMFVVFQKNLNNIDILNISQDESCEFVDLGLAHRDILENKFISISCNLGLFRGDKKNFLPTNNITKGQALAVLMRMTQQMTPEDEKLQPNGQYVHRARSYRQKANDINILDNLDIKISNLDDYITRGDIAILLYRSI